MKNRKKKKEEEPPRTTTTNTILKISHQDICLLSSFFTILSQQNSVWVYPHGFGGLCYATSQTNNVEKKEKSQKSDQYSIV